MASIHFSSIPADWVEKIVHDKKNNVLHGVCTEKTQQIFPLTKTGGSALAAPSVSSVLHHIKEHMPEPKKEKASSSEGESEFYSFKTFEEAWETYAHRPHELAIFKEAAEMIKVMDSPGIEIDYDVVGDDLDMGRFLEGDPLCYSHMVMGNVRGVVANVYVSTSAPYWVDKEAFSRKVARICRLCDWLETNRVRTKITAIEANQMGIMEVVVKEFDDPMYLPNVAVVAHGDFLRRMIFRVNEYSATWSRGYGTAINLTSSKHSKIKPAYGELTIVIDQATDVEKVDAGFDQVEQKIAELIPDINAGKFNGDAEWPVLKVKGYNNE